MFIIIHVKYTHLFVTSEMTLKSYCFLRMYCFSFMCVCVCMCLETVGYWVETGQNISFMRNGRHAGTQNETVNTKLKEKGGGEGR